MRWVESVGGPLVVVPFLRLRSWSGVAAPKGGRTIEARSHWGGGNDPPCDYDRACDVDELIGVLELNGADVLVLGDEPLATSWLPRPDGNGGTFARLRFANDFDSFEELLLNTQVSWFPEPNVAFDVRDTTLLLFDSGMPGDAPDLLDVGLQLKLQPGRYAIESADFRPNAHTSGVLHRLERSVV